MAPGASVVLVWLDPAQTDDKASALLAGVDAEFVVARCRPTSEDLGRTDLLSSVRDARDRITARGGDPDELILVGFGPGAVAATGLARYAKRLGIGVGPVVAAAGEWDEPDPFSGAPIEERPEQVELVDHADHVPAILNYLLATTLRRT